MRSGTDKMLFLGCVDAGALTGASEDAVDAQSARMRAVRAIVAVCAVFCYAQPEYAV